VLWWAPNPREVLLPADFRRSRSLTKTLRNRGFEVTFDADFAAVIAACAARRENSAGTWITPEMHAAYCELHARGHAHSVEVRLNGALVGGLYGVLMGRVFFGESMFSRERDASKVAFARLVERALVAGLQLIDCQLPTAHLRSLGSRPMPRAEFSRRVWEGTAGPDVPLFADA
jgi:leucyl/phenylalanyl-tRNA--protein transferase